MTSQAHRISTHNSRTRFLSLPSELKNEIYDCAFDDVLVPGDLSILLVCRQIQHEAQGLANGRRPIDVWDKYDWHDEEDNWDNSEVLQDLRDAASSKRHINYHIWNSHWGYEFDTYMKDSVFDHVPRLPEIITLWDSKNGEKGHYSKGTMLKYIITAICSTDYYFHNPVVVRIPLGPGDRKTCSEARAEIARSRLQLVEDLSHTVGIYLERVKGKLGALEEEYDFHIHDKDSPSRGVSKIRICTVAPQGLKDRT